MFHNYPYSDLHEINLDWFLERFRKYVDEGGVIAPDYVGGQYGEHTRYYIACNSGSDDNDGLTASTPWASLDRLLDKVNEGLVDARCYFIEAGNYYITHQFIANAVLHLAPTVNGVNIILDYDDEEAFYLQNCHIKWGRDGENYPLNVYPKSGYGITAEGGEFSSYYTTFHEKLYTFGTYVNMNDSGADWFRFSGGEGTLSNTTILNDDPGVWAFYLLRGANIYLTDNLTLTNLSTAGSDDTSVLFYASSGSHLWINCTVNTVTNKYYHPVYMLGANLYSYGNRLANILQESVTGKLAANKVSNVFANDSAVGVYGTDLTGYITDL